MPEGKMQTASREKQLTAPKVTDSGRELQNDCKLRDGWAAVRIDSMVEKKAERPCSASAGCAGEICRP